MNKEKWQKPKKISWRVWLTFYVAAIALNHVFAPTLIEKFSINTSEQWQVWLISTLPAILAVSFLLLIRTIWYQTWLVYQQSNEYIHNEKIIDNQDYWSESLVLEKIIFRCGQLADFEALKNYLHLSTEQKEKSAFETMNQQILSSSEHKKNNREDSVLSHLADELIKQGYLSVETFSKSLWLWMDDKRSWQVFRQIVIDQGGSCPLYPDKFVTFHDINWLVDRYQEEQYQNIILLGFEAKINFEMYLAMVFSSQGKIARVQRAFEMENLDSKQAYFMHAVPDNVIGFLLDYEQLSREVFEPLVESLDIELVHLNFIAPKFFQQLNSTRYWMQMILAIYYLDQNSYAIAFSENEQIVPISRVKNKKQNKTNRY